MADMEDVLSPEEIEKRNNDNNNKQQESTIEISDNDEQQTAIEISNEQVNDISSLTGFTHEKKHKEGVTQSKRVPVKGKKLMKTKSTKSFISYKSFKSYLDCGLGRIKTVKIGRFGIYLAAALINPSLRELLPFVN